jgi:dihydroorotase
MACSGNSSVMSELFEELPVESEISIRRQMYATKFSHLMGCLVFCELFQAGALDKLEAFASLNGPLFYGLPVNTTTVTLEKAPWKIPSDYKFGSGTVVPICAGETLQWSLKQ